MITLNNMSYAYRRRTPVFDSIDLQLDGGGITGLLGLNGVGKTTLLKLLSGLLKPQSGSVRVLDKIPQKRTVEFLQRIFFVPDRFELPPRLTANSVAQSFGAMYPSFDAALFHQLIDAFSVQSSERIGQSSLGQQKKILLALGFASRPQIMLMDEPTSGLDIPSKSIFRDILIDQIAENRHILISTHEARELPNLLDNVCLLNETEALSLHLGQVGENLSQVEESEISADAIYSEKHAAGATSLVAGPRTSETQIDVEFLFRAFVADSAALRTALSQ